jgi:hypothetical protein
VCEGSLIPRQSKNEVLTIIYVMCASFSGKSMLNLNEAFMIGNVMNADIVAEHQASL